VIKTSEQYFKPIFDAMWEDARNLKYKHMDETTVVVIEDKKQEGRSKSYEWVLVSGRTEQKQMALYFYNNSREHGFVDYILGENATGFVMSDGYEAYRKGKFVNVGCLAHVRRMFYEACTVDSDFKKFEKAKTNAERLEILNNNPSLNTLVKALSYIGHLFDLDAQQENRAEMKIDANKVMDEFFTYLDEVKTKFSSKGLANKAINYTLNAEEYIRNYLLDENLEISNNRAERAIKPFVIGRKNCLFSNTKRGAKDSSILYSIIESAKLNNLNALEYLNYCLKYLATNGINDDNIQALLPYSDKLPKELYLNNNPN
ncbi:MAG: IS66 family transposase, partial [Bacillota bacterium]|nr:IS66 family transposase [Bacillota bacterium]